MTESGSGIQKMGQVMSTSETRNKFLPEILEIILSHLGKHDLLMSRLVSRSWNEDALKVLRKSKFTQTLSEERIKNIIVRTVNGTHPFQFLIPFHLNFNINFKDPKHIGVLYRPIRTALTIYVESLRRIFGSDCVSRLTLTTDDHSFHSDSFNELGLLEFLTSISTGLKSLDLTGFKVEMTGDLDCTGQGNLSFPILRILKCNTRKCKSGTKGPGSFYISIIENSPHLEHLELTDTCDMDSWPLRIETLKSLYLASILNPEIILAKIYSCPSQPVLRHFRFRHNVSLAPVVYNILESISPTLKSLRLRRPHVAEWSEVPVLTKLPQLTYIGFEYFDFVHVFPQNINFNTETLPSLTSVELPIGFFSPENICNGIEFPNVNQLMMRVCGSTDQDRFRKSFNQLQIMFPKPSKFSIINGLKTALPDHKRSGVKFLLGLIIQSDWSKNIREFEMNGFHEDYLGQVLDRLEFPPQVLLTNCERLLEDEIKKAFHNAIKKMGMDCLDDTSVGGVTILQTAHPNKSHKMKNIISVTLKLICKNDVDEDTSYWSPPEGIPPNFTTFAKHFPLLQTIQISELLFCEWKNKNVKKIDLQFTSEFPNVKVNIT